MFQISAHEVELPKKRNMERISEKRFLIFSITFLLNKILNQL